MPPNHPRDNPFAPPEAPLFEPEPDPGAQAGLGEIKVGFLLLRWELARLTYNGVAGLLGYGLWRLELVEQPRNPIIALLLAVLAVNLGFCL